MSNKHNSRSTPGARAQQIFDGLDLQEAIQEISSKLKIKDWDYLIVSDGSGSDHEHPCGWAAMTVERITLDCRVWYGAVNRGTVNFAEILGVLQPLTWISAKEERRKGPRTFPKIHIITDSNYARQVGDSANRVLKSNIMLWQCFDVCQSYGYQLNWHWCKRDELILNRLADALSKQARLDVQNQPILAEL